MITQSQLKRQRIILSTCYVDYNKKLCRYAASRTHSSELGEDLVQHTFLKTWTYLVKGGKINSMEAFLYHVLKSLIIDEYRKRKISSLDQLMEKGFDVGSDDCERVANVIDGKQIARLIPKLPMTYQKVVRLRYLQDLSLEEVSSITGESKNTVAVKAHRGLSKLKKIMETEESASLHTISRNNVCNDYTTTTA
jgi:RNA polymerase sigma-70 factor (ECF subfamily)